MQSRDAGPRAALWGSRAFLLRTLILVIPLMLMLGDERGQKVGMERGSSPLLNPKPVTPLTRYPAGQAQAGRGQETGFCSSLFVTLG